ncbi:D-alanyl-D-alanine-carboxypeptidase/endopeptidase AmpH precursor [Rosistilla carotiformis]|uniref:D-alanyl-D-alanine-carboxypeptidase/endopeptidase AmpH n=1 Tax=Rosistilla carotiformis TaxID=2528017 RepID=A0A518K1B1_9BACT|nr:serine hydrolase domain-containing protein [Rosistilla carotiformis]QDV71569.1 D-alanyl-D-alanine-carboxypeptidase/endopeptidase AmpH precursor [Rosistilla carotiformis]
MIGQNLIRIGMLLVLASAVFAAPSQADDDVAASIQRLATPYIESKQAVGLSIGVLKGDQATTQHFGQNRTGGPAPDDNTIYEIASISKVFTGLLLADAVARKQLQLDQAAQELLPKGVAMPAGETRPIQLDDLATHRSGLPRLPNNMPSLQTDNPYADYTTALAYEFLSSHDLRREPDAAHEYSNLGFALLGSVVADRAQLSYDQLLQQRIAEPLQMTDTRVEMTASMRKRLATPHTADGTVTANWDFADMPGAGGIRSSLADMMRFAAANLNPESSKLGPAIEIAWRVHRKGVGQEPAMGLGWHIAGDGSTRWHNGQTGGYHSMLMIHRQAGIAVVVLSNTASKKIDTLAVELLQAMAQH